MLVSAVMFMEFLDASIINTAVPSIARDFHVNPLLLKFAVTSYYLALAVFIPISGWCTDQFGTKKTFLFSITLFTFSSLACAFSTHLITLTLFRFLQGIGGAFMSPVARILIVRLFPPQDLVRIQGYVFTPAMLGHVLGPFLGGLISTYLSWHWIFYINLPAGLVVIYFAYIYVVQEIEVTKTPFDKVGFSLIALSLGSLTFCVEMIGHFEIVSKSIIFYFGLFGALLFIFYLLYSRERKNTVLDFSLLKIRTFCLVFFFNFGACMTGAAISFILPLMFQEQFGMTPAKSGFSILPIALGYLIFRLIAPRIIKKIGFRRSMQGGSFLMTILLLCISRVHPGPFLPFLYGLEFLYGGAYIVTASAAGALIYYYVPKNLLSRATALDMTFRQFSLSMGVAFCAMALTLLSHFHHVEIFSKESIFIFQEVLCLIAFWIFCSFVITWTIRAYEN